VNAADPHVLTLVEVKRDQRRDSKNGTFGRDAGAQTRTVAFEVSGSSQVVDAFDERARGVTHREEKITLRHNRKGDIRATPLDSFERALRVNVVGTFNAARLVGEAIARQGRPASTESAGVIVMTSSVAAFDGQIGQAAYAASKGAVAALTLPLAREFATFGVRVASIAPGLFDTPMLAGLPEEARARLAEQPAFPKRLGRPEEFAALALHIIENEMINGETIRLDGAIRLPAR
jgi:NAD(P)-dependent dehydrogenase (short-subunit alcohol dehydrogenase family)